MAWFAPLSPWTVACLHERKRGRCWLTHSLSLKEPVLAQVNVSFHLPGGKVEPNRDRQVITGPQRGVHILLVHCRQARQELRVVGGGFSLRGAKDPRPLPAALDPAGNRVEY